LIGRLNEVGGANGVGRFDMVENRLVGIKSREIYEAPGAHILLTAHEALEEICLSRLVTSTKRRLSITYSELIYNGLWFSDLREALDAFFVSTQKYVTGSARVKLFKGMCAVTGKKSPHSLYSKSLATYGEGDVFRHKSAEGFLDIWNLPLKAEGVRRLKDNDPFAGYR